MDYNNILNNKRKFNELKNKTMGILSKATDKITEVTSTAVDSVVDTVKNISQQQAKLSVFEDVISAIDSKLINSTLENQEAVLKIAKRGLEDETIIFIDKIVSGITATYEESLKEALCSEDYLDAIYGAVKAHYNHESGVKYKVEADMITLSIITAKDENKMKSEVVDIMETTKKNEQVKTTEEHVCGCEERCDYCTCEQEAMTLEYIKDEK